jgi:hypothetical protein
MMIDMIRTLTRSTGRQRATAMAAGFDYFEEGWRTRVFTCRCGWSGTVNEMFRTLHRELMDYECPSEGCETMLVIVSYPTRDETLRAAEEGNEEAIREAKRFGWR